MHTTCGAILVGMLVSGGSNIGGWAQPPPLQLEVLPVAGPSPLHSSWKSCRWLGPAPYIVVGRVDSAPPSLSMPVKYLTVKCPCGETSSAGTGKVCRNGITKQFPDDASEAETQTFWDGMAERMANHVHSVHDIEWHKALAMLTPECFEVWSSAPVPVRSRSPRQALTSASSTAPIGLPTRSRAHAHPHQFQLYDINGRMVTIDLARTTTDALVALRDAIDGLLEQRL